MDTTPLWRQTKLPHYASVANARKFDVVIVGGGITGLTAAYLLKKSGKTACVLERDHLGAGDTGQTSAHLAYVTDSRLHDLVKSFGKESARLAWQGGVAAISSIEAIVSREGIDCDFRRVPGFLHASLLSDDDETEELQKDADLARELGFAASFVRVVPVVEKPGIRFANQARIQPLSYLASLARAIDGDGSAIFENSEAAEMETDPLRVKANGHWISAEHVVIATHVPLMGNTGLLSAAMFQTKLAPYSSYVVGAKVPQGSLPEAEFWDTSNPYFYLRVNAHRSSDYVIFGGLDHKTGQADDTEDRFRRLQEVLHKIVPAARIDHRWSGQVVETHDGLPYIGETAERQFVATGFSGNGMTFGTLGAMMATDWVLGRDNPWQDLFSVSRKKLRGAWDYLKENFDFPYYLLHDRLSHAEADSIDDVAPGEGKVLKLDGERVACSRDEHGKTTIVSAVCTHMGCLVHWNTAERTWDCPCHGSRFKPDGQVLAGPAETPLEPVSVKSPHSNAASDRKQTRVRRRSVAPDKGR